MIYVRDDIPSRRLNALPSHSNMEGIFLEINLRKSKWLIFGDIIAIKFILNNFWIN